MQMLAVWQRMDAARGGSAEAVPILPSGEMGRSGMGRRSETQGAQESGKIMTNTQLYLAIGIPVLFNVLLFLLLRDSMKDGFASVNKRFDDMRDLWRAELHRVEDGLDARLKHIEEREKA